MGISKLCIPRSIQGMLAFQHDLLNSECKQPVRACRHLSAKKYNSYILMELL